MNSQIITFYIVSLFLVISPGPNMALIIDNATRLGKANSLANVFGLCTATYFHGALSILGISAIVLNNKYLFLLVKTLGALYLLYMGIRAIRSGVSIKNKRQYEKYEHDNRPNKKSIINSYTDGFKTQILNPKVSIFYMAAFPKFIARGGGVKLGFELVTIHSFNIFIWFTFLTIFISFASNQLRKPTVKGNINILTGIVLSIFSIFILFG